MIKKTALKKVVIKKAVKKSVRNVAAKKSPLKKPAKKLAKKLAKKIAAKVTANIAKKPIRKIVKAAEKKIVAAPKVISRKITGAPKQLTKTAERKAVRAAKAAKTAPKAKAEKIAKTVWPPLVEAALRCLDDAKAEDVITIDLAGKSTLADTMIVASGRSNRHVNAIADQLMMEMKKHGQHHLRVEGIPQCDWVVVDAGDILLHIFRPEVRSFYNLEKLWSAHVPE